MAKKVTPTQNNHEVDTIDLTLLNRSEKIDLLERLNELDKRLRYNKLDQWFPPTGPYRAELYPKQMAFFDAGAHFKERVIFGGNKSGKSTANYKEVATHATGRYPANWKGKRFEDGDDILIWCAGDSHNTIRDIAQFKLLGNIYDLGTGMIPKEDLVDNGWKSKQGIPNALASVVVKRQCGGFATIMFMSYEQGRKAFQGTDVHVISFDEEPTDPYIYSEAVTRTMVTNGIVILTFTPLSGLSDVVLRFLPDGTFPEDNVVKPTKDDPYISRWITNIEWDDVPHLSEEAKNTLFSSYLPHERESRVYGRPAIGSGKIFKTIESDFTVEPFEIPYTWPRVYGMDFAMFGGSTAAVWAAIDPETECAYIYDVYRVQAQSTTIHAAGIRRRGTWIPGVIDPSALKRIDENTTWLKHYKDLGLDITLAKNAVDAGIAEVTQRLEDGRLRVFKTCSMWFEEYRLYRTDKHQKVAKNQKDDLLDATRYLIMSGLPLAVSLYEIEQEREYDARRSEAFLDLSRDSVTGY